MLNVITFTEVDGRTLLELLVKAPSKEVRDVIVNSGMELGLQEQMEILDELLASMRHSAVVSSSAHELADQPRGLEPERPLRKALPCVWKWRTACAVLPSASSTPISARWAVSRSGSAATAATPASSASASRPSAVRRSVRRSSACARRTRKHSRSMSSHASSYQPGQQIVGAAELRRPRLR